MLLNSRERLPVARETDQLDLPRLPELPETGAPAPARDLQAVGFVRDFMTGLTEPAMIPAFLAGGMAYRALRWGAAGQWVASPAVKTISGLLGRQLAASTVALGGEVVAFTGAQHGARAVFNLPAQHPTTLGNEMTGTAIMLGSLRSFGFGGHLLGGALQRAGLSGAGTRFALSQASSYAGLLTAQQIEHRLLHPDQAPIENPYLNAAVSLIHFTGFNLMARNITPRTWQLMEHHLEQKTQKLFSEKWRQIQNDLSPQPDIPGLAWQGVGFSHGDPKTRGLNFMWGKKASGTKEPKEPPPSLEQFLERMPAESKKAVIQIDGFIDTVETPFVKTLFQTKITVPDTVDLAVQRFRHILEASDPNTAKSTYFHWMINIGLRRIVEKRDSQALDPLMTMLTQPTPMRDIENFLAQQMAGTRLPEPWMGISNRFKRKSDYYETIEKMPLSGEAKKTLWLLLIAQKKGPDESPYYTNPHELLNRLRDMYLIFDNAKWMLVQSILEKAPSSPLGILRIKRLSLVLRSELPSDGPVDIANDVRGFMGTKLRELENDQYRTSGPLPDLAPPSETEIFMGPVGGFLGPHGPWKLLRDLNAQIPDLIDPVKEARRREKRQSVLKDFFAAYPSELAYRPENIAEAYLRLSKAFAEESYQEVREGRSGDFSFHVGMALKRGEFNLEALSPADYAKRFHQIKGRIAEARGKTYQPSRITHLGIFINANDQVPGLEKPLILVTRPDISDLTPARFYAAYAAMLAQGIHEGWHAYEAMHRPNNLTWSEGAQLKQEMTTFGMQHWWEAQHGNAEILRGYVKDSPTGAPTRLLDFLEENYRKYWEE